MLELNYIRENKNEVILGLEKRNFKDLGLIEEIILTDKIRRKTQKNLDSKLHEANSLTKEIEGEFSISKKGDYSISSKYSDTLRGEKNLINNLINEISEEIFENLASNLNDL